MATKENPFIDEDYKKQIEQFNPPVVIRDQMQASAAGNVVQGLFFLIAKSHDADFSNECKKMINLLCDKFTVPQRLP